MLSFASTQKNDYIQGLCNGPCDPSISRGSNIIDGRTGLRKGPVNGIPRYADKSIPVSGGIINSPTPSTFPGTTSDCAFKIERFSRDMVHARYSFELTFPIDGDWLVYHEGRTIFNLQPPEMDSPIIYILSKKGRNNKWFDSRATQLTRALYASQLGGALVNKKFIRAMKIRHVLWIESADGVPIAAAMIQQQRSVYYRLGGLAVDDAHKRKGYGSALMSRISQMLPRGSMLLLGVDTGKDATKWLTEWYIRLGFVEVDETYDEILLGKAILKHD